VKVHVALRDVAEMLDGAIKERKLVLDGPPDDVNGVVWADADRVRQILVNLVMNAVKYSTFGSGTITLRSSVSGNAVVIEVADAGPGIPRDKLEAIFEPFVQLANAPANRGGGVGLGLAISRDLARKMGGDLTVESTVGVGSRFTLTLPRARTRPRVTEVAAT
jgi:signal transduction histidine kinase